MPKVVDVAKKREEFIMASWDVIAKEGLTGATLRRVAAEAGCTTGSLTKYFPDRSTLMIEVLRAAQEEASSRMLAGIEFATTDYEKLESVLLESLPLDDVRLREWRVWLAFWGASHGVPELLKENKNRYREWQQALDSLVEPLLKNKRDVAGETYVLRAIIDGMGLRVALSANTKRGLVEEQKRCREQLFSYLIKFRGASS